MHLFLILPFPPSVNGLFSGKSRRFTSSGYRAWQNEATEALIGQDIKPVGGNTIITYGFQRPDKRQRDVQNYIKAVSDFLVDRSIITDDSLTLAEYPYWLNEHGNGVLINIYGVDDINTPNQIASIIHATLVKD